MFSSWLQNLAESGISPAVVGGITFRCALAALTAFVVAIVFGGWLIRKFRKGRVIEDTSQPDHDGLNAIQSLKKDVPTMGGLIALAGIVAALLLWSDLRSGYVQAGLLCLMSLGVLGLVDDYIKLRVGKSRGLRKRTKLSFQFGLGAVIGLTELIEHGVSGLLYPPGDWDAAARLAGRVLDDEAERMRIGTAAARRAAAFALRPVVDRYERLYDGICSVKAASRLAIEA